MSDEASGSLEGKCLSNLRVVDLKMELDKRGLSKSGSKKELIKRLKQKLELEKLYEESSTIGDCEPKLQLDEATEQNEFVKQYLAEQQKIYARQKEVKRLIELREEEEKDSESGLKDQDSDVSEGYNVSKNSCDSSTHAEGGDDDDDEDEEDQDEEERKSKSKERKSISEATDIKEVDVTRVQEPESSCAGDPCESMDNVSQLPHGVENKSELTAFCKNGLT